MVLVIVGASVLAVVYFGSSDFIHKKKIRELKKTNILLNVRILNPKEKVSVSTSLLLFKEYEKLSKDVLHGFTYELSLFLEKRYQLLLVEGNFTNIFDAVEQDKNVYAETSYLFDVFSEVLKKQKVTENLSAMIDFTSNGIIESRECDLAQDFANQLKEHRGSMWLGLNKSKQEIIFKLLSCKKPV